MSAEFGRCRAVEDDDGLSRLDYPGGPAGPSLTRESIVLTSVGNAFVGTIDLIRPGDEHLRLPDGGNALTYVLKLPQCAAQPFYVLPDALAGPGPVAPALVELATDLANSPSVAPVGRLREGFAFACRISLTDAARTKLRAALARHEGTTRPVGRQ